MRKMIIPLLVIAGLLLASCQAAATAEPTAAPAAVAPAEQGDLTAQPWQWLAFTNPVEQYSIDNPQDYILTFNTDGTVNVKADCNVANGTYTTDGSSLSVQLGPMTLAACPETSRSDTFIKNVGFSAIYFFKDGHLFIDLFADGGTMEFAPAE